ncbi:DUF3427 domain-containing protein [Lacticaseibacillus mingshuiensis]|uniref:DUF3427 domain-containing protein n=1 Tax=Lacticaseibacillus mingshuiensis TaxID=2799574 RepID=A0ABW4CFD1_9LACO|nr:DEAD/DEAH box helicase [Lacticaseibacillus mingshuiensis]
MNTEEELRRAADFGFIDDQTEALEVYQPMLVTNQKDENVLSALEDELRESQTFTIAVAFVTLGGLLDLKPVLADLAAHGIRGRLITSTYLGFNDPRVFADLLHIPNLDVRIVEAEGFHTKAYYFQHRDFQSVIIGSANLTQNALKVNFEWNLRVTSTARGDVVKNVSHQLATLWQKAVPLTPAWIAQYTSTWQPQPSATPATVAESPVDYAVIKPNRMQLDALAAIQELREQEHARKALIVAATGTGKTILAALDVQRVQPRKLLYVVHREQILRKSLESFKAVLGGPDSDYGILSGSSRDTSAKYLFATINMIIKPEIYAQLGPDAFDYILIDEAHRVSENAAGEKETMYQRLLRDYQPAFMLGMTATPDRMDGRNVYEFFDYNLAYEISLLDALDDQMLVPFHYIGVPDFQLDGQIISDTTQLKDLVSDERVDYLISKTFYYGPREGGVHGLIFVSRLEEGAQLAKKLTARGIGAEFVSGSDSVATREEAVRRLENSEIQYIVTVDVFNEGIDIPSLNQVVMMRPTQSSIIFLQQLGRGLRRAAGKEFLTVLDFIGNYKENYLIPLAFERKQSSSKDTLRRKVISPTISGVSTIRFEEVARKNILQAVNRANMRSALRFKQAYQSLQAKVGRPPLLLDFAKFGNVAVEDIIRAHKTVYDLRAKVTPDDPPVPLSKQQYQFLIFLSREIAVAKRPVDSWVLGQLLAGNEVTDAGILAAMQARNWFCDAETVASVARGLTGQYFQLKSSVQRYGTEPLVVIRDGEWTLAPAFAAALADPNFRQYAADAIAVNQYELQNGVLDLAERFSPGEKYYRSDVIRLLNWDQEKNGQNVGGYMMRRDHRFVPVFIALEKTEKFQNKMAYDDQFIDRSTMRWYSKSGRTTTSAVESVLIGERDFGMIQLFVKKSDHDKGEGTDFYYLGPAKVIDATNEVKHNSDGKATKLVNFKLKLAHSVPAGLYRSLNDFDY